MKRVVFILICIVGLVSFTSCGSTAPCGLSQKVDTIQQTPQQEVVIAEAIVE